MSREVRAHAAGGYTYLPGPAFASAGVRAEAGKAIRRVSFPEYVPLLEALHIARGVVESDHRPVSALCGLEMRTPSSLTEAEFDAFNRSYANQLEKIGITHDHGAPSLARTNVVPVGNQPTSPSLVAFSYTIDRPGGGEDFVLSGAADTGPWVSDSADHTEQVSSSLWQASVRDCASQLTSTASALGIRWTPAARTTLYSVDSLTVGITQALLGPRLQSLEWHPSAPPLQGPHLEIDVHRNHHHLVLETS